MKQFVDTGVNVLLTLGAPWPRRPPMPVAGTVAQALIDMENQWAKAETHLLECNTVLMLGGITSTPTRPSECVSASRPASLTNSQGPDRVHNRLQSQRPGPSRPQRPEVALAFR